MGRVIVLMLATLLVGCGGPYIDGSRDSNMLLTSDVIHCDQENYKDKTKQCRQVISFSQGNDKDVKFDVIYGQFLKVFSDSPVKEYRTYIVVDCLYSNLLQGDKTKIKATATNGSNQQSVFYLVVDCKKLPAETVLAQQKADEEIRLAEKAERQRIAYEKTPEYKAKIKEIVRIRNLTGAIVDIIIAKEDMKMAQDATDRERQVGAISGYVNTRSLYGYGELIMRSIDRINYDMASYRKYGGKARTLSELLQKNSGRVKASSEGHYSTDFTPY